MSSTRSPQYEVGTPPAAGTDRTPAARTGWTGWLYFGAFMMFLIGFFQAIEGLAAIVNDNFTKVSPNGLVVHADYTVWGWVHLVLGVLVFLSGLGVLSGRVLARMVGVALAVVGAVINLAFLPAQPAWGVILVSVNVLLIYALIVHGGELRD
jgi:hypothetical protein